MRSAIKASVEALLLGSGVARIRRTTQRSHALVLAYHNVVPHGQAPSGDRSLHLPQEQFARQLDVLLRTHEVVTLDEVLEPPRRPGARPRVAISFDDAYRGAVTAGVAELAHRGLPATIFVAPAFVGGSFFWWDLFSDPGSGAPPAEFREHALRWLEGRHERVVEWAGSVGRPVSSLPEHAAAASEAELHAAVRHPGITLGSHTWSHPNLATLDRDAVRAELVQPLEWLRRRFDAVTPWISYPYGMTSPLVAEVAAATGYRGGLRVEGGWLRPGAGDPFATPRLNVSSGMSVRGFRLRASGLFRR